MSATNAALSRVRPFSLEKMQSSAKYFFHVSALPGTTASNSSWVRRTSSSCEIASPAMANCMATNPNMAKNTARTRGGMFMFANACPFIPRTASRNTQWTAIKAATTSRQHRHASLMRRPRRLSKPQIAAQRFSVASTIPASLNQAAVGRTVDFLRKRGSSFSTSASAVMPCFLRRIGTAPCSIN